MDKQEGIIHKTGPMDTTGQGRSGDEERDRCVCSGCPTYNECMREKNELIYCIAGRSPTCAFEKRGCICPTCPVKVALGLSSAYYCIRGSEQEQKNAAPPLKKIS
jgi:hypothetical protein